MELKKLIREPVLLFMIILFPAVMTIAFGLAFGGMGTSSSVYDLGIVNLDSREYPNGYYYFIGNLSETELFNIIDYDTEEAAEMDLVQGRLQAVIVIPENFGASCRSAWDNPADPSKWVNATIDLKVDSGSMFAVSAIPPLVQKSILITLYGEEAISASLPIQLSNPSLVEASDLNQFDFMAPGLFVFSGIFIIMIVAQTFTEEREQGLLKRIFTTPTTSGEIVVSTTVSYMIISLLQTIIVFLLAFLIGYRPLGGVEGLFMAFLLIMIFSWSSVGFGSITAAISKSAGTATGISFIFIIPQMFFGTFMPMGAASEIIGMFIPSYYATDAITSIFLRGAPITSPSILIDLFVLTGVSLAVLVIGIFLFKKYGKK